MPAGSALRPIRARPQWRPGASPLARPPRRTPPLSAPAAAAGPLLAATQTAPPAHTAPGRRAWRTVRLRGAPAPAPTQSAGQRPNPAGTAHADRAEPLPDVGQWQSSRRSASCPCRCPTRFGRDVGSRPASPWGLAFGLLLPAQAALPVANTEASHLAHRPQCDPDRDQRAQQQGRGGRVVLLIEEVLAAMELIGHARRHFIGALADEMVDH